MRPGFRGLADSKVDEWGSVGTHFCFRRVCAFLSLSLALVPAVPAVEIQALIVISDGGRHIHEVVSQIKVGGVLQPSREVSADDWKVESSRNAQ